jgi:predicted permease
VSEDIACELDTHVARLTERYVREGMLPHDAQAAAHRKFGNVTRVGEDIHDLIGVAWLEDLVADVRHGLRQMRHAPAFAAAVIATLALGIGANSAIFAVTNAVLLKPLPAPDPDRVFVLATTFPEGPSYLTSDQKFNLWRQQTSVLQAIAGHRYGVVNLTAVDRPEQAQAAWITDEYFQLFGIPTARGRSLIASDTQPGAPAVAILSDGFWRRAFGSRSDIIGARILLSDARYEVIGVTAAGIETTAPDPVDVWLPLSIDPASASQVHYFTVEARLKPGITVNAANAQLAIAADAFRRDFPAALAMGPRASFGVQASRDALVANVRPALLVLMGAVALVLLIACVNVANLQFIRAIGRERELAVRAALGASRARIARQLVAEGLPMGMAGGTLGLFLGTIGIRLLLSLNPGTIPRIGASGAAVAIDLRVLIFTAVLSLATGLICSLPPAIRVVRIDLNTILKNSGPVGRAPRHATIRSFLIVLELALTVVLLAGAALLIRTFIALRTVEPGVETASVLTLRMSLSGPRFATTSNVDQLIRLTLARMEREPGVRSAAYASALPLEGGAVFPYVINGRPLTGPFHGFGPWTSVSTHYFDVFGIALVRGRLFTEQDGRDAPGVVIINEAMAARSWPGADPLHQQIFIGKGSGREFDEPAREIIGIVANVHDGPLDRAPQPAMYVPAAQLTDGLNARIVRGSIAWVVRTGGNPQSLASSIQREVQDASGGLPVARVRTMMQVVARTTQRASFNMWLLTLFAVSALVLASIGLYGLVAYSVQDRTPEIAIRMSLGAEANAMRNMVLRQGLRLTAMGIVVGAASSWALARVMATFVFGVTLHDPLAFAAAPLVLGAVALFALWRPALRATNIRPADVLR